MGGSGTAFTDAATVVYDVTALMAGPGPNARAATLARPVG
jgi:hypothetical protein